MCKDNSLRHQKGTFNLKKPSILSKMMNRNVYDSFGYNMNKQLFIAKPKGLITRVLVVIV